MSLGFNALQETQTLESSGNIARHLPILAKCAPNSPAIIASRRLGGDLRYRSISYCELDGLSNRYAGALSKTGISKGDRTLLMVRQGFDFIALVFALFKIGAVPVLIDPGMGIARLLDCIRTVKLEAFVGIPLAHVVRTLRPGPFQSVKFAVTVGRRWFWGGPTLAQMACEASDRFEIVPTTANKTAAILFTSGSTGPAKGVVYTHGMFDAQVRMIQSTYNIQRGEIDLPTFPLFALFSVAMGMTIVLPDMDPSHPARVNPHNIIDAIRDHKVTNTFGSPALWKRVADCCASSRLITLPTLRRILIAGAPVPPSVIEQLHRMLSPDADVHTPYGATESLPVSTICGNEVVKRELSAGEGRVHLDAPPTVGLTQRGAGTCVGHPVEGTDVTILRITDGPISQWTDDLLAPAGDVGEITVTGPSITCDYFRLPRANALAKIVEGDTIWHRLGDLGYFDEAGRLWFCGRKAHRVQTSGGTLFTECIEPIANQHPAVARCALVGVGSAAAQMPVLIVELNPGYSRSKRILASLTSEISGLYERIARQFEQTENLGLAPVSDRIGLKIAQVQVQLFQSTMENRKPTILFRRSLPVDIRHNAKINRELLADWAARYI